MTRSFRSVVVFISQEEAETLGQMYPGMALDRVIEGLIKNVTMVKIIKRCARCDKEIQLLVPKTSHPVRAEWFQNVEGAQCNKCNPKSMWRRVEDCE